MIVELFYPRELKNIIGSLKAKKDLNLDAYRHLNFTFNFVLFPVLILSFVFLFFSLIITKTSFLEASVFLFLWLSYCFFYIRGRWRTHFASYILGKKTNGILESYSTHPVSSVSGMVRLNVSNINTGKKHSLYWAPVPIGFKAPDYQPSIGQNISYFLAQDRAIHPTPAIYPYMKKYCLKQSMLKEE